MGARIYGNYLFKPIRSIKAETKVYLVFRMVNDILAKYIELHAYVHMWYIHVCYKNLVRICLRSSSVSVIEY